MTSDNRTADQIERDIENERAQLSGSINDLQKKFSVESIVRDVGDMFRGKNGDIGGEIGRSIAQTIARNPAATALTAVGLAWMMFGATNSDTGATRRARKASPLRGARRSWQEDDAWFHDTDDSVGRSSYRDNQDWSGADYGQSTAETAGQMADAVQGTAGAMMDKVKEVAGDLGNRAADLKDRLMHGTEHLSDEAKARVRAAREAAHSARMKAEQAISRGSRAAAGLFEEQPLVVGAIAVAVGAAIGGALPRSRMEDEVLGESRDRLFAEAQSVFQEERRKAMSVLAAAKDEAKAAMTDVGNEISDMLPEGTSAGTAIVDRLADAGIRVVDSARDEADRQGMMPSRDV